MALRTYYQWRVGQSNVPTLPSGTIMRWPYPQGGSCQEVEAAFFGTSVPDRIATSKPEIPSSPRGWQLKNCGTPSIADDWRIVDPGDGTGGMIMEDGSTNPTNPTTPDPTVTNNEDMAGWTNQGTFTTNQSIE